MAGVQKEVLRAGSGPTPQKGATITVHCTGSLKTNPPKKFWRYVFFHNYDTHSHFNLVRISLNFLHCALRDLYSESVFEIFLRNLTSKSYASRPVILFHYFFLFLYTCFKNRNGQILSFLPEIARLLDHGKISPYFALAL